MRIPTMFLVVLTASVALAATVKDNLLQGQIRDWDQASGTGEVRLSLGRIAPNNMDFLDDVATAPVDEKGQFKLALPAASKVAPALLPKSGTLKFKTPCTGTLTVNPPSAVNFFDVSAYDSFGLRLRTARLATSALNSPKPGDVSSQLAFSSVATRLTGRVQCDFRSSTSSSGMVDVWEWDASLNAGWNQLTITYTPVQTPNVRSSKISATAVPGGASWHLYRTSVGLTLDVYPAGMAGGVTASVGSQQGLQIRVDPGSSAEKAGLVSGDYLLEVNGRPVDARDLASVEKAFYRGEVGQAVTLKVRRGDRVITVTLKQETQRVNCACAAG